MSRRRPWQVLIRPSVALAAYLAFAATPRLWTGVAARLFPEESRLIYERTPMLGLIGEHVLLVLIAVSLSTVIGIALGLFVTRRSGADFYDVVTDLSNFGQTFPPVAVLALSVPLMGLGFKPTVFALTVYGVLPVLRNTVAGIESVPAHITESARAMGMRPFQILYRAEMPAAAPVIFAGVRVSAIVGVATATIGATIGAGGLGGPIISGLQNLDPAITLQGGLLAAGLALIIDAYLRAMEGLLGRTVSSRRSLPVHVEP